MRFSLVARPRRLRSPQRRNEKNVPAKPAVRYRSGFGFMLTSDGLSPIAPPWTSLTAYDLNKGTIKWKIPLGDVPELAAKGNQEYWNALSEVWTGC